MKLRIYFWICVALTVGSLSAVPFQSDPLLGLLLTGMFAINAVTVLVNIRTRQLQVQAYLESQKREVNP